MGKLSIQNRSRLPPGAVFSFCVPVVQILDNGARTRELSHIGTTPQRCSSRARAVVHYSRMHSTATDNISYISRKIAAILHDSKNFNFAVIAALTATFAVQNSLIYIVKIRPCVGVSQRMGRTQPPSLREPTPTRWPQDPERNKKTMLPNCSAASRG